MLAYLTYVSRRIPAPGDVKNILESSRRNNPLKDITGALCLLDGVYFQYLEGDSREVVALYKRIELDPRHNASKLLGSGPVKERKFGAWAMALVTWNEQTKAIFNAFAPDAGTDLYAISQDNALTIFDAFARTPNWAEL